MAARDETCEEKIQATRTGPHYPVQTLEIAARKLVNERDERTEFKRIFAYENTTICLFNSQLPADAAQMAFRWKARWPALPEMRPARLRNELQALERTRKGNDGRRIATAPAPELYKRMSSLASKRRPARRVRCWRIISNASALDG